MSRSTLVWIAEIVLVVIAGYFALWFALLTLISFSDISKVILGQDSGSVSWQMVLYSVIYFVTWLALTYLTSTALKAARNGGEWKWR